MMLTFTLILIFLAILLMLLNYLLCLKLFSNREKLSVFECGFDPSTFSRLPFSMHFFLVALIFLIFDVEISLLIPLPLLWQTIKKSYILWLMSLIVIILLIGALIEWKEGSLDWQS